MLHKGCAMRNKANLVSSNIGQVIADLQWLLQSLTQSCAMVAQYRTMHNQVCVILSNSLHFWQCHTMVVQM